MKVAKIILGMLILLALVTSVSAVNRNVTIRTYLDDNTTVDTGMSAAACTLTSAILGTSSTVTIGTSIGTALVQNASDYAVSCVRTSGANTRKVTASGLNITVDRNVNLTRISFNFSIDAVSGALKRDETLTLKFNITNNLAYDVGTINITAYYDQCGPTLTFKNVSSFTANEKKVYSASIALATCAMKTGTVVLGIKDTEVTYTGAHLFVQNESRVLNGLYEDYYSYTLRLSDKSSVVISDDTFEAGPKLGSDLGNMMGNLAPGIGKFILILGVFVGVTALVAYLLVMGVQSLGRYGGRKRR